MEEQLKFFPPLTLAEIALRKTAILLWSHPDVLDSVSNFKFGLPCLNKREIWKNIEDIIKVKVLKLPLPELLMKQLSHRVTPVGLQIREWKSIHQNLYRTEEGGLPGSTKLCWTTTGRISYRETAKELFRTKSDVVQHYTMACDYCLEDCVALFWEKLPENAKEYFSREDRIRSPLSFQWPHMLKGDYSKLDEWSRRTSDLSFNQESFQYSARAGNKSAAGYFLKKLTHEEREVSVGNVSHMLIQLFYLDSMNPAGRDYRGICYLLTLMTPKQQMETLKEHPLAVFFSLFLDSVWTDPFTENAALIWKHLSPRCYFVLQRKIAARYESTDHHSPLLLEEFFARSPPEFKKQFVSPESESSDPSPACRVLSAFFKREDSECAGALFRNFDAADRVKLVFHVSVLKLLVTDILWGQWHTVRACLRGAALSEGEFKRLKEELAEVIERRYPDDGEGNLKLENFFDFFNGSGSSAEKSKKGKKRKLGNCSTEQ